MKEQSRTKMLAHDIPLRAVKLLNVILMTIPFAWCWYGYSVGQMENSVYYGLNMLSHNIICWYILCLPEYTAHSSCQ